MSADPRRPERVLARRGGGVELLRLPALAFGAIAWLRAKLYDRGWLPIERLDVPVVCVGNLTAGGTGKTPMVAWVVRELQTRGWRPGVASRGYRGGGRKDARGEGNDEARLLARELADVPHVQDADRAAAGRALVARGCDVVVLDDGFQHRRLARDLDVVLVDATRPWGLPTADGSDAEPVRALLPRGLLRESPRALARADAIVVTRADQVAPERLAALERELEALAPGRPLCRARHRPNRLRAHGDPAAPMLPSALSGRAVDLLSGVGNPDAFEATVRALGARLREHRRFPDHHPFAPGDLDGLGGTGPNGVERWVVTTAKDAARLDGATAASLPLFVLEVDLVVDAGRPVLAALLDALRPGRARRERSALHEGLHG
jgi:tetraacyldisaccharide 4'-kinase